MRTVRRSVGAAGAAPVESRFRAEAAGVGDTTGVDGGDGAGVATRRQGKSARVPRGGWVCPRAFTVSAEVVRVVEGRWFKYIADIGCWQLV